MRARWIALVLLIAGCGDDDQAAETIEAPPEPPTLAATDHAHCLPSALEGARIAEPPSLSPESEGRREVSATYERGEATVRVDAILYRDAAEISEEREFDADALSECAERPFCEERTIGGVRARINSFEGLEQESTNFYFDPGVRVSVVAPPGRSAAFAELIDLDCLRALHADPG